MNLVGTANQKGRVAEWSNAVVLKTTVPQGTVGSNPTPSAFFSFLFADHRFRRIFDPASVF